MNQITFANPALLTGPARGSVSVSKFTHETGHDQSEITGHEIFEMTGHATETTGHDGLKYAVPAGVSPDNAEALRADGSALDAMLEASGIDPENIISEFSDRRRN